MDYAEAIRFMSAALAFGIRPGLHRMYRLMAILGNPEAQLRCIHIAGTNGKGSVSSYCAAILATAGKRVGIFTSPHLVRHSERIRVIAGSQGLKALLADETSGEIEQAAFAAAMTAVRDAVTLMLDEGYEHPTEFELVTAVAFLHFAACCCDVVVLEIGLGGLLDSTNVIRQPLASIITALGYDHMDRLGNTLAEIATNKAGIIKDSRPVFFYNPYDLELTEADAAAALEVIQAQCGQMAAPLTIVRQEELDVLEYGWDGQVFRDKTNDLVLRTGLLGVFQPMNAALAARTCLALQLASPDEISEGVRLAYWPARLEVLRRQPSVLIDGAHNLQCCQALADALVRLLPDQPVIFLTGMLRDKDYAGMLRLMLGHGGYLPAALICVTPDSPRALPAAELADCAREVIREMYKTTGYGYNILDAVYVADTPSQGVMTALQLADDQGMALCVFTSLYVIGTIRDMIKNYRRPSLGLASADQSI